MPLLDLDEHAIATIHRALDHYQRDCEGLVNALPGLADGSVTVDIIAECEEARSQINCNRPDSDPDPMDVQYLVNDLDNADQRLQSVSRFLLGAELDDLTAARIEIRDVHDILANIVATATR